MEKQKGWAKFLQNLGVFMLALTGGANFFIGLWTAYVGFFRVPGERTVYHWGYIALGLLIFVFSIMMLRAFMMLANKRVRGHHYGVIALVAGVGLGLAQLATARSLTVDHAIPAYVTYLTIVNLAVLLLFMVPSIWSELRFYGKSGRSN